MPVILHVDELEPGMRLFQALLRGNQVILPAGRTLEEWEINSLRRRFPDLRVRIGDPILDELGEFEDDGANHEVAATVNRRMSRLMGSVRHKLSSRTALEASDLAGLQQAVASVISYLSEHPVTAAILTRSEEWSGYLQEHAANVFYLSLLIGNAVREYVYRERVRLTAAKSLAVRYGMNLTPLAVGALLHDIGMLRIAHVYEQSEPLGEEDRRKIQEHPLFGESLLPPDADAVIKMVVRTHHEQTDGSGYPLRLPGHKQHIFSRIVRVADAFDAATSDKVYARAKSPARVLWEMLTQGAGKRYDPALVKILMSLVQPFPIGAKIRLSTGQFAVVTRHNRRQPFRPTVLVAFDENGKRLPRRDLRPPIDLARNEDIRLTMFGQEDLSFLNGGEMDFDRPVDPPDFRQHDELLAYAYP